MLLYQAGYATQENFDTIPETGDDFATAKEKLDNYFTPKKNVTYKIFQFRKAVQQSRETVDQFDNRLRKLASTCEFTGLEKELKSTIIQNCQSKHLRRVALCEDLSFDTLLDKARSQEASEEQAEGIEQMQSTSEAVNVFSTRYHSPETGSHKEKTTEGQNKCFNCGFLWPRKNGICPAKGRICNKCGKMTHFAKVCLSKQSQLHDKSRAHEQPQPQHKYKPNSHIHHVVSSEPHQKSDSSSGEYLYTLGDTTMTTVPKVDVKLNGITISMIIDTGASTDIIDEKEFTKVNQTSNLEL